MSSDDDLSSAQAQEVQEQLFTTHRGQISHQIPVPLPRRDFWQKIRALLSHLDMEIQALVRKGSIDMRLQNLQKRQTNIRRIASELARKRMVAMMQHAASQALRSGMTPGMNHELPALDWQRHDPAEKAFYHAMQINLDRFKKDIEWTSMQQGMLGELMTPLVPHAPGTMQLDAFVSTGTTITSGPPPALAFEDDLPPLQETEVDEEERLHGASDWTDEEAFMLEGHHARESTTAAQLERSDVGRHAAAMELAPSPSGMGIGEPGAEPLNEPLDEANEAVQPVPAPSEQLVRIRILQTMPEPIVTEDGDELVLESGDIHVLSNDMAEWLIDAGVAEGAAV